MSKILNVTDFPDNTPLDLASSIAVQVRFLFFTENIMNVTGWPSLEILNKHVVTCYNDKCRCMSGS